MKKTAIGAAAICFSATLWGLDGIVLTPRLFNLDVGFVVFLLHFLPFLIMNIFLFREYKYLRLFSRSDYFTLGLVSLFGGAVGTLAIVKALFLVNFQQLSVVVLLQKLQPVFAIILAAILLKERIRKNFAVWAALAVLAGYFLTFGFSLPDFRTGDNTAYAAMYALLAAFSFGSATVFGKKILKRYDFYTATFYRFGFTSLIMLVYAFLMKKLQFSMVTPLNWMIFLVIAFTTGSAAIFLYYFGLTRVKAIVSTICELCFPISAIIFDYFINGNILSLVQSASAVVMIIAIIKVSSSD